MKTPDIQKIQYRVARVAIAASTARGCPKGTVEKARKFLSIIQLAEFSKAKNQRAFNKILDDQTNELSRNLPNKVKWGHCRKFLNIFLRDALYNQYLSKEYKLQKIEAWLEVPLDGNVGRGIYQDSDKDQNLDSWKTIKGLNNKKHQAYQEAAQIIAKRRGIHRVHLDLDYY